MTHLDFQRPYVRSDDGRRRKMHGKRSGRNSVIYRAVSTRKEFNFWISLLRKLVAGNAARGLATHLRHIRNQTWAVEALLSPWLRSAPRRDRGWLAESLEALRSAEHPPPNYQRQQYSQPCVRSATFNLFLFLPQSSGLNSFTFYRRGLGLVVDACVRLLHLVYSVLVAIGNNSSNVVIWIVSFVFSIYFLN